MNDTAKRIIIAVLVAAYIINPVDLPGPVDDIIVTLIGTVIEYKLKKKQLPDSQKDSEQQNNKTDKEDDK